MGQRLGIPEQDQLELANSGFNKRSWEVKEDTRSQLHASTCIIYMHVHMYTCGLNTGKHEYTYAPPFLQTHTQYWSLPSYIELFSLTCFSAFPSVMSPVSPATPCSLFFYCSAEKVRCVGLYSCPITFQLSGFRLISEYLWFSLLSKVVNMFYGIWCCRFQWDSLWGFNKGAHEAREVLRPTKGQQQPVNAKCPEVVHWLVSRCSSLDSAPLGPR